MTRITDAVEHEVHRPDFWLRVIVVFKAAKVVVLLALGIAAFALAHSDLRADAAAVVHWLGLDPARPAVEHVLADLAGQSARHVEIAGAAALIYAAVFAVEAWGLHRRRRWAEWLVIIVTSSLIPFEVYELATHPTIGKGLALIANIAIVIYLLHHRRLFGGRRPT